MLLSTTMMAATENDGNKEPLPAGLSSPCAVLPIQPSLSHSSPAVVSAALSSYKSEKTFLTFTASSLFCKGSLFHTNYHMTNLEKIYWQTVTGTTKRKKVNKFNILHPPPHTRRLKYAKS